MLEDEDVVIPEFPKISPTLEKLLRRILVKDYLNRIDWKELFEYTITESGEIYAPGVSPTNTAQFGLRASIRNATNFGSSGLNFSTNNGTGQYGGQISSNNNSTNDSIKGPSPILSPKPNKEAVEESRNYLMKKKSPLKMDEVSTTTSTPSNGNSGINTSINYGNNLKNEQFAKNDKNNRV